MHGTLRVKTVRHSLEVLGWFLVNALDSNFLFPLLHWLGNMNELTL